MNKTLLVMNAEISATLRRKLFTIFAFGVPLVLGAIALIVIAVNRQAGPAPAASGASSRPAVAAPAREGYVDQGDLIRALPAGVPAGWLTKYATEAAAQAALQSGEITGYYVIPADYVQTGQIVYARPEYNPLSDRAPTDVMEWLLLFNLLGGNAELTAQVRNPLDVQVTQLAAAPATERANSWFVDLFPTLMTLILYMVILLPAGVLVNALIDEKKNRVMEVLMTSVSPQQIITGKILALGLLGLLQTAIWVGVMWMVVRFGGQSLSIPPGFTVPTSLVVWAFVYFLLGYAMYGSQLAGLGALAADLKDTRSATLIIMGPLIVTYMFMIIIFTNPNSPLSLLVSLFPLTSPIGMIARMTVTEVPLWQAALAAVLQLLTAVLILRLIARLFRAQTLLSGQPFSLGRYLAALWGQA
jgi:ABC-2 type transport system permease protein